jgi:Transposase DDE domain
MVLETSLLVTLVTLIDRIPCPPADPPRRGRPVTYSDRLFLKALVIMVLKWLPTVHALLAVLEQPTPEMRQLRALLTEGGRFPARRTWERRLAAVPATLPALIACLGQHLIALLDPWHARGRAVAIDSTVLHARGGVWHQKHRAAGIVPHTSIDTEAHWTKSGWHGWVYGWKLHLVITVAGVWIPLRAALTPANAADNELAAALLRDLPADVRFVLGDSHYQDPALHERTAAEGCALVATRRGAYPHTDDGVAVRRIFHKERSVAIENFNGQFKAIFDVNGPVPTRGLVATARWVLGAVLVYQLTLLSRHHLGLDLRTGLKPFLQAA